MYHAFYVDSSYIGDGLLNIAMSYGELPDIENLMMAGGLKSRNPLSNIELPTEGFVIVINACFLLSFAFYTFFF